MIICLGPVSSGFVAEMNATSGSTVPASHRQDYTSSAQLSVPAGTFHFYANTITARSMPARTDTTIRCASTAPPYDWSLWRETYHDYQGYL
jgi:hypothetical protein